MDANTQPRHRWKRFRHRLEAVGFRLATEALSWLPYSTVRRLANALGWCAYHLAQRPRRIALANLDVAFGDTKTRAEKERIALCSMQNFANSMLTLMWSRRASPEKLNRLVEVDAESMERAREVLARGKGVVCVTLHYGNWELFALAAGTHGFPLHIVTETLRNTALEQQLQRLRSATGNRIVPQKGAAMKLLRALRCGEVVILITDLNPPVEGGGEWLEFFGLPAFSNVAAAALAVRTGAPLFSCHAIPLAEGRIRVVYGPEIPYTVTGDWETDLERISQQCLAHFEQLIRQRPELWLWSYKRWKHRRDQDDPRYPFYTSKGVLSLPRRANSQTNAPHNTSVPNKTVP